MMTTNDKPYSAACERNREPILTVLREHFAERRNVLEIGSGTGQHAAYFSAALPHLAWQASDREENLAGIRTWLADAKLLRTPPPIAFDVATGLHTATRFDAVFSANTLHIMSWHEVQMLFAALPALTAPGAIFVVYGPFNYAGTFTNASNAAFDAALRQRAPQMGIRDVADVDALAAAAGFDLIDDVAMPANNRCRIWLRKR
jgi:SAM-dependent methyltransferase